MRKFSRFLMALILTLGLCVPARAAGAATVSISSGTVSPGGEVTLTVSIQNNPGIAAVGFFIYYDTSVFSFDRDAGINAIGSFGSGTVVANTLALARENGRMVGQANREGLLFGWFNGSGMNAYGDGGIFTVTLRVSPTAAVGEYWFELDQDRESISEENGKIVPITVSPGVVTVGGGAQTSDQSGSQSGPQNPTGQNPEEQNRPGEEQDSPYENPVNESMEETFDPARETAALFQDTAGNWAESCIRQAAERGLIQGYNGLYRPNDSMTRAELVTILWRANGSPAGEASGFTDLTQSWYLDAVAWAERTGAVNGVGGGHFDPDGHVTREQLAAILHRMAGSQVGMEAMVSGLYDQQYVDSGSVSDWAKASLYWNVFNEIYCGEFALDVGQILAPRADASRAQIAVMMVRYLDKN